MRILSCIFFSFLAVLGYSQGGLIAHYKLDGDAVDASRYQSHGIIQGGVTPAEDRFGNPCGALYFNGSDGYISVPSTPALRSPSGEISVVAWIKLSANCAFADEKWVTMVCKSDQATESATNPQFRFQTTRGTVSINYDFTEPATADPDFDTWALYVLTFNGSSVDVYLNTDLIFSFPYSKTFTPNDLPMDIGRDVPGNVEFFCGTMDDLRLYNRSLSFAEIQNLYSDQSGRNVSSQLSIVCPDNIEVQSDPSVCGKVVDYPEPVATDYCAEVGIKLEKGLVSGSKFPVGSHKIVYSAKGRANSQATCSFKVKVNGSTDVTIQCPSDRTLDALPGKDYAVVDYPEPVWNAPCANSALSLVEGDPSGSKFKLGTTKVTYQVDNPGGKSPDCSFNITVIDKEGPELTCPKDITVNNDPGECTAVVKYSAPTARDNNSAVDVDLVKGMESGSSFPVGITMMEYQARDAGGNLSNCRFSVKVIDVEKPKIDCPEDQSLTMEASENSLKVQYADAVTTDNCPNPTVSLIKGLKSNANFPAGSTGITFKATDGAGNSAECSFRIVIEQEEKEEEIALKCPPDKTVSNDPTQCHASVEFPGPELTGEATVEQMKGRSSGERFPVGQYEITYRATSPSGKTAECGFTLRVKDREEPEVICPDDITVEVPAQVNEATVQYEDAEYSDNCPNPTLKLESGPKSGSKFPLGRTLVTFEASDKYGNTARCYFGVSVKQIAEPEPEPDPVTPEPEPEPTPKPEPEPDPVVIEEPVVQVPVVEEEDILPDHLTKTDTIVYEEDVIFVKSPGITLYFYDHQQNDGDIVSVNFDGKWVLEEYKIRKAKKKVELDLTPGKVHYLVAYAHNEGRISPNTLTVNLIDGVSRPKKFVMETKIGVSSGFKIVYKP